MGIVAPLLGGVASKPVDQLPRLFADTVFERYLCAAEHSAAVPSGMAAAIGFFCLEETHPVLGKHGYSCSSVGYEAVELDDSPAISNAAGHIDFQDCGSPKVRPITPYTLLGRTRAWQRSLCVGSGGRPGSFTNGLPFMLFLWFALIVVMLALETSQLLLFFSSSSLGGPSLSKSGMSALLAIRRILICLYEINVFPTISERFGYEAVFRVLICVPFLTTSLYLIVACAALSGAAGSTAFIVAFLGISAMLQCITQPVFLCGDILIPSRTPHPSQLSTVNALGEIVAQAAVGLGAWYGSSIFAWSASLADQPWLKGRLGGIWLAMIALTAAVAAMSQKLSPIEDKRKGERLSDVEEL